MWMMLLGSRVVEEGNGEEKHRGSVKKDEGQRTDKAACPFPEKMPINFDVAPRDATVQPRR
jgi:hypothetical protein